MAARKTSQVVNLCFHGIGAPGRTLEPGEAGYWVDERSFLDVLDLVAGRSDVRLSFDDGNSSDLTAALPGLLERGLTAEFFVLAARLGKPGSLAVEDVRALRDAGMSIGSHGMHHRSWRGISDADLDEELGRARDVISAALEAEVDTAACPLGGYDRRVLGELRRREYRRVMTSDRATADPGTWLQPRFSIRADDDVASVERQLIGARAAWRRARNDVRILAKSLR